MCIRSRPGSRIPLEYDHLPIIESFFRSRRPLASPMALVVDDGMRGAETFARGSIKGAAHLQTCRDRIIEISAWSLGLVFTPAAAVLAPTLRQCSNRRSKRVLDRAHSKQIGEAVAIRNARRCSTSAAFDVTTGHSDIEKRAEQLAELLHARGFLVTRSCEVETEARKADLGA